MLTVILIKKAGTDMAPAFYLMTAAAVSLIVVLGIQEPSRRPIN
jgi:hypothetical protein